MIIQDVLLMLFIASTESSANWQSLDELSKCVVYLTRETVKTIEVKGKKYELWLKNPEDKKLSPWTETISGTGFLIATKQQRFLVTASHVAMGMDSAAQITVSTAEDRPYKFKLTDILPPRDQQINWISHEQADVAVLPVSPIKKLSQLEERFLPMEMLSRGKVAPGRELELTVIGFPLGLGIGERFSPITKNSRPASGLLQLARFDTNQLADFFLLDQPSVGGYSGAPVFVSPLLQIIGPNQMAQMVPKCVGLTHGTISDNTGGKFAAVVPAWIILELLEKHGQ